MGKFFVLMSRSFPRWNNFNADDRMFESSRAMWFNLLREFREEVILDGTMEFLKSYTFQEIPVPGQLIQMLKKVQKERDDKEKERCLLVHEKRQGPTIKSLLARRDLWNLPVMHSASNRVDAISRIDEEIEKIYFNGATDGRYGQNAELDKI